MTFAGRVWIPLLAALVLSGCTDSTPYSASLAEELSGQLDDPRLQLAVVNLPPGAVEEGRDQRRLCQDSSDNAASIAFRYRVDRSVDVLEHYYKVLDDPNWRIVPYPEESSDVAMAAEYVGDDVGSAEFSVSVYRIPLDDDSFTVTVQGDVPGIDCPSAPSN